MAMSDEGVIRGILDFTKPVDVALFDQVINLGLGGGGNLQHVALQALKEFKENSEAWRHADKILRESKEDKARYIALVTLDDTIRISWNALPDEQRVGIRNFVINMIMDLCTTTESLARNRMLVTKLNDTLVQILKKDWPERWPSFIQELVDSAKTSDSIMQNNLAIIGQLSDEIFNFSKGKMTRVQVKIRKEALNKEFPPLFQILDFVFKSKHDSGLITEALGCLLSCLSWIPLGYVFETKLIEVLVDKFLRVPITRNLACKCLTEIASLSIDLNTHAQYRLRIIELFRLFVTVLSTTIPVPPGSTYQLSVMHFCSAKEDGNEEFVQNYTQFLITACKTHLIPTLELEVVNSPDFSRAIQECHNYLIGSTHVDHKENLKSCVEYWSWLSLTHVLQTDGKLSWGAEEANYRKDMHRLTFFQARKALAAHMARPEEVVLFEDDNGEIVREVMKDVDAISFHNMMKEGLVALTHLDCDSTESILLERLDELSNPPLHNRELERLCWAIGAVSGAVQPTEENAFLIHVIKTLLTLCARENERDSKASIAADIMYVIGQYPRFLHDHWKFLKIVVQKLFEFMLEMFEGVRDMACDTFLKLAKSCKERFVEVHHEEDHPFVVTLLHEINKHSRKLDPKQTYIFYEAVGVMVSAAPLDKQEGLVQTYMGTPNEHWHRIMAGAGENQMILQNSENMDALSHILKCMVCGATSVGEGFRSQVFLVFNDMMKLYATYSQLISQEVASKGPTVAFHAHVRQMRIVKKNILKLVQEFCQRSSQRDEIAHTILPPLLETVLTDYNKSVVKARDPQVISLMTVLVEKLESKMDEHIPLVLDAIMGVTLEMITTADQDYPEHRNNFFKFLQALNKTSFSTFLQALQVFSFFFSLCTNHHYHHHPHRRYHQSSWMRWSTQ